MISANGGLPAHRYTPQVTPRLPRGSEPASRLRLLRVAMVIARVAEIEICSESVDFDYCLVGFFIIKYRLQCLIVVAVTSHSRKRCFSNALGYTLVVLEVL